MSLRKEPRVEGESLSMGGSPVKYVDIRIGHFRKIGVIWLLFLNRVFSVKSFTNNAHKKKFWRIVNEDGYGEIYVEKKSFKESRSLLWF